MSNIYKKKNKKNLLYLLSYFSNSAGPNRQSTKYVSSQRENPSLRNLKDFQGQQMRTAHMKSETTYYNNYNIKKTHVQLNKYI